jgi:AraC-like DNA-binding protein
MFGTPIKNMLISLAKGSIRFAEPWASGTEPCKPFVADRKRVRDAFYPPQFHPFTEMIFGLSGKSLICTNNRWASFSPGQILVFLPGAIHSERYFRQNLPYQILWTTLTAESINFHITAWNKSRNYHLPNSRVALQLPNRDKLCDLAVQPDLPSELLQQILFQALLMDMLCQALKYMENISPLKIPYTRQMAEQIRHYIDHHYQQDLSLEMLADMVHYSPCHMNMIFRKEIGMPIRQYILQKRLQQAEHLLLTTHFEIKQIAFQVGFTDPLYFSRLFRKHFGHSPTRFERQQRTIE